MNFHPLEPLPSWSDGGSFGPGRRLSKGPHQAWCGSLVLLGIRDQAIHHEAQPKAVQVSLAQLWVSLLKDKVSGQGACFVGRSGLGGQPRNPELSEPKFGHHHVQHGQSGAGQNQSSGRPHCVTPVHTWYGEVGWLAAG